MDRSLYFMDISDNNPTPDLAAYAAAGHVYLAVKISEGTGYYNPEAAAIIDGWHAHGAEKRTIGYHWFRPDQGTPQQQADFYLAHFLPHWRDGDRTMNDWERSTVYATGRPALEPPPTEWAAEAAVFNNVCHARNGAHTLYTGNWYLDEGHPLVVEAQRWPVILSDYSGGDGPPNNRLNLKIWARQFTDKASVPGISRPVDYNHILNPAVIGEDDMTKDELLDALESDRGQAALQSAVREFFELEVDGKTVTRSVDSTIGLRQGRINARLDKIAAKLGVK